MWKIGLFALVIILVLLIVCCATRESFYPATYNIISYDPDLYPSEITRTV
jgi:hypothetical protein